MVQALSQAIFALRDIANYIGLLHERILYFDKYFSFLGIASGVRQPQNPVFLEQRQAYTIEFNKVGFTYPDGRTALADVSFKILAGETIALVGENGAGKSTIVKLLLRFYDPTSGRILVNGCDLKTLDLAQWRKRVGAVFQDFNRYDLSLRENIALADLSNLSDEQKLTRVVDKVALSDLMRELPEGLDTKLGKEFGGTELSGGQWQKIAIARGLLKGVSVLILDEPTASVDPRSEFEIFERFAKIVQEPTTILITHRLASVRMVNKILVLRDGHLIEYGSHKKLLSNGGEYFELWALQSETYIQMSTT